MLQLNTAFHADVIVNVVAHQFFANIQFGDNHNQLLSSAAIFILPLLQNVNHHNICLDEVFKLELIN